MGGDCEVFSEHLFDEAVVLRLAIEDDRVAGGVADEDVVESILIEVDDLDVRDGLSIVNKSLRHLRTQIEQGLKDNRIRRVNGFLDFADMQFATYLETLRNECVENLNKVLARAHMPPVN